eukprot:g46664.t1
MKVVFITLAFIGHNTEYKSWDVMLQLYWTLNPESSPVPQDAPLYTQKTKKTSTSNPQSILSRPEKLSEHICLLDCIVVDLQDMDIFTAVRYPRDHTGRPDSCNSDLLFPSYLVRHVDGNLLKERCWLKLQVERNLDKEISHAVPDVAIHGSLSSVHCSLDLNKYKLIRGLIQNNLGEPIEEFMRPFDLQDPSIH